MELIAAITALIGLCSKLLPIFIKTPEQKRDEMAKRLVQQAEFIHDAFISVKATKDTSAIEKILNKLK